MESSDHGLSEYLYNVLVVPFILTQDREEVNPSVFVLDWDFFLVRKSQDPKILSLEDLGGCKFDL